MARTNVRKEVTPVFTLTGTPASRTSALEQLRRTVLTCILWEDNAYESGVSIVNRITTLIGQCDPKDVADLAFEARWSMNLRHVPLKLMVELARNHSLQAKWLTQVIGRADELCEFLALYWQDNADAPISNQAKLGLREAFAKFDAYQIAKYQGRDRAIKLRDVMRLVHPTPLTADRSLLYKQLISGDLAAPETWEAKLSGGANKREVFTDLITNRKLGSLALLRNLRGMQEAGVSDDTIRIGLSTMKTDRLLPFNFLSAAKYAPKFVGELEQAMFRNLSDLPKLKGKTVVIVDVSGSMGCRLSSKSELTRLESASAIAMLIKEVAPDCVVYATAGSDATRGHRTAMVPSYRGFALRDAIVDKANNLGGGGIFFKSCVEFVNAQERNIDRLIVITDECDTSGMKYNPQETQVISRLNYVINIASSQHGVAYNKFHHINGFSEACINYISAYESNANQ